jgi:hypothetical protein
MGNTNKPNLKYKHTFWSMEDEDIEEIQNYKIIESIVLDKYIINQILLVDNYFDKYPTKSKVINNMLNYCLEHEEKEKFKTADYICNKRIKVCICNSQAEYFRKMTKTNNYIEGKQYISWLKKL